MSFKRSSTIGFALMACVPLWLLFAGPKLQTIPRDFSFTAEVVSTDNFYNSETQSYDGAVFSKTNFFYQTIKQEGSAIIVRNVFDVRTPDNEPIFAVERLYGIDRQTGKHVSGLGDESRDGYLFAPRDIQLGESFRYWHINYDGPADMRYMDREILYGLTTYHYQTNYEGVKIDQTANLTHLPGVGITRGVLLEPHLELWIEPVSGQLIKYKDDTIAYYYDLQTGEKIEPWNHFSNTFNENSVEQNVLLARWAKTKIRIIEVYVPALILILVLLSFCKFACPVPNTVRAKLLKQLPLGIGLMTILVSASVLIGWMIGSESLIRVTPSGSGMNPLTAICFVLLGSSIVLRKIGKSQPACIAGMILTAIGIARLAAWQEITGGWQIDLLLFREAIEAADLPARMSAYTALCFIMLGLVPCGEALRFAKKLRLVEIFPTIVLLFSIFAVAGYMFDLHGPLAIPLLFSTAIHTALLFLFASLAIYVLYKEKESALAFKSWLVVSTVLFITLLVTVTFTVLLQNNLEQEIEGAFGEKVNSITTAIDNRIDVYINALQAGKGLFVSSDEVERDEWQSYVAALHIQENYPGIQGMGYSVFVTPEEKQNHINTIRAEGFPEFTIRPEGERDLYSSIIFLEPFDARNKQAFGFDMYQEATRRLAMQQARDTGEPHMSGRITLVQEIDSDVQPGFLIYVPFYGTAEEPHMLAERRASIKGFIYAPFRARDFVEGAIDTIDTSEIGLIINDGVEIAPEHRLFDDYQDKFNEDHYKARFTATRTLYLAGRPWILQFQSSSNFGSNIANRLIPLLALIAGIIMSSLISAYFYTIMSSRQKAINYADELTKDLRRAKAKDEATLTALNQSALVSITDVKGNITYANEKFVEVSKYSLQELLGNNHRILKSGQQPDTLFENLWYTISHGNVWRGEIKNKAKDGTYYWVDTTISPILDINGVIKEYMAIRFLITDKKEAELNLQVSKTKDEAMLESIGDGLIATDKDGVIILVNSAFERIVGWQKNEVQGKKLSELLPMLDDNETGIPTAERPIYKALQDKQPSSGKTGFYRRKDGTLVPVKITVTPTILQGELIGAIEVLRDITQEKEFSERQKEFISLASHQLRTPLTAIRWAVSKLSKNTNKHFDAIEQEMVDTAYAASRNMAETINVMLRVSHVETGEAPLTFTDVNVVDICKEIQQNQSGLASDKNIAIHIDCPDDLVMHTDQSVLSEILTNLMNNAVKYTPEHGSVAVKAAKDESSITIKVVDTGYGIPKDQADRIFSKFFRASNVTDKVSDGTGLGLYLVHELVLMLGGTISFESIETEGTTFTINLPLTPPSDA